MSRGGGHQSSPEATTVARGRFHLVAEALGERVIVNLQLSQFHVLVGRDCNEASVFERNGNNWSSICWSYQELHEVLVHGVQQDLIG